MFENEFYPTPQSLLDKMYSVLDVSRIKNVLEPSAGRGDIIEYLLSKGNQWSNHHIYEIDCIEYDPELRSVLEVKGFRPVAKDFLEFKTFRTYDLIMMNPPFSNGHEHLAKAIELQKDGGQIVCLLNAETIRNPFSNARKALSHRLTGLGAKVEYINGAFTTADRTTNVEVAMVYIDIPYKQANSDILLNLISAQDMEDLQEEQSTDLVEGTYPHQAVRRYEIEVAAGLKLIDEYSALKKVLSKSLRDSNYSMIELIVDGDKYGDNMKNRLVYRTRMKYWQELFKSDDFRRLFTEATRDQYTKKIEELGKYEFNEANIAQMKLDISKSMLESLDDSIVKLFEEFSSQYYDEQSKNIHYFNGWKTNKAYVINKKVITRCSVYSYGSLSLTYGAAHDKITDIHKVFSYLDGKLLSGLEEIEEILREAQKSGQTTDLIFQYCKVTFYKKGTMHITFTNPRLLKKFNLIGSQRKGWLPPTYGKVSYEEMPKDHQQVVDSLEGAESYNKVYNNIEYYALPSYKLLC